MLQQCGTLYTKKLHWVCDAYLLLDLHMHNSSVCKKERAEFLSSPSPLVGNTWGGEELSQDGGCYSALLDYFLNFDETSVFRWPVWWHSRTLWNMWQYWRKVLCRFTISPTATRSGWSLYQKGKKALLVLLWDSLVIVLLSSLWFASDTRVSFMSDPSPAIAVKSWFSAKLEGCGTSDGQGSSWEFLAMSCSPSFPGGVDDSRSMA